MTKIKTNGSLGKLASPGATHKDVTMFDYKWRRNSSSSTSEEEGSENGTIKRRPGNNSHHSNSHTSPLPVVNTNLIDIQFQHLDGEESGSSMKPLSGAADMSGSALSSLHSRIHQKPLNLELSNQNSLASKSHSQGSEPSPRSSGSESRSLKSPLSDIKSPVDSDCDILGKGHLTSSSGVETSSEHSLQVTTAFYSRHGFIETSSSKYLYFIIHLKYL